MTANNPIRYDLIALAIQVFERIPDEKIDLRNWYSNSTVESMPECGTIACGLGQLSLSPEFQALGLCPRQASGVTFFPSLDTASVYDSIYQIFGGRRGYGYVYNNIFSTRGYSIYDDEECLQTMTDKQLLINRCRMMLINKSTFINKQKISDILKSTLKMQSMETSQIFICNNIKRVYDHLLLDHVVVDSPVELPALKFFESLKTTIFGIDKDFVEPGCGGWWKRYDGQSRIEALNKAIHLAETIEAGQDLDKLLYVETSVNQNA